MVFQRSHADGEIRAVYHTPTAAGASGRVFGDGRSILIEKDAFSGTESRTNAARLAPPFENVNLEPALRFVLDAYVISVGSFGAQIPLKPLLQGFGPGFLIHQITPGIDWDLAFP